MLSSPWGTFLPVVLGTLHQSEMACTPSLRFVIPLHGPCQAFATQTPRRPAKYSASLFCLRPVFSHQGFAGLPAVFAAPIGGFFRRVFAELFTACASGAPPTV